MARSKCSGADPLSIGHCSGLYQVAALMGHLIGPAAGIGPYRPETRKVARVLGGSPVCSAALAGRRRIGIHAGPLATVK